jgi:3-hydroxyisobutyrate dehydrogenase-like beta-hydroxyacid dehydrogenase
MIRNIAVISPGDMGHSVGRVLAEYGFNIFTCLEGRSERTQKLAHSAQFKILNNYEELVDQSDLVMSILPPDYASELVDKIVNILESSSGRQIYFVDCNAISPSKSISLAEKINNAGGKFIDGGIIGLSPSKGDVPRFYVSGPDAYIMKDLDGQGISVQVMSDKVGDASAIKMCYAALTKGTNTLQLALLIAAQKMGVLGYLKDEFESSQQNHYVAMEKNLSSLPANSHRWIGEMKEIARTFQEVGVTPLFHQGSEEIYKLLLETSFADETPETIDLDRTVWQMIESLSDMSK